MAVVDDEGAIDGGGGDVRDVGDVERRQRSGGGGGGDDDMWMGAKGRA